MSNVQQGMSNDEVDAALRAAHTWTLGVPCWTLDIRRPVLSIQRERVEEAPAPVAVEAAPAPVVEAPAAVEAPAEEAPKADA